MRSRKVTRYYCDFCRKAGCSRHHMEKHEKRCTMNPNRECGMCKSAENVQPKLSELVALLPAPKDYEEPAFMGIGRVYAGLGAAIDVALPVLREKSNNCPACILAALRQSSVIPIASIEHFNFKKEVEEFWSRVNSEQAIQGQWDACH
jgi:hypothetical protein